MSDSGQHAPDLNKNLVDFVIIDLNTALRFMDLADTSRVVWIRQQNHRNAREAYDTAIGLLGMLRLDAAQQAEVDLKLATLKHRLIAVGQNF